LPSQPVDATPSIRLIQQYFPYGADLLGCAPSFMNMVVLLLNLTIAKNFGY
jgi:hypothetical protein